MEIYTHACTHVYIRAYMCIVNIFRFWSHKGDQYRNHLYGLSALDFLDQFLNVVTEIGGFAEKTLVHDNAEAP